MHLDFIESNVASKRNDGLNVLGAVRFDNAE